MSSARHRRSRGLAAPLAVGTSTGAAVLVAVLVVGAGQQGDGSSAPPHRSAPRSPDVVMVDPASGSTAGPSTARGSRSGGPTEAAAPSPTAAVPAGAGSGSWADSPSTRPATAAAMGKTHPAHPSHPVHPTQAATSPTH